MLNGAVFLSPKAQQNQRLFISVRISAIYINVCPRNYPVILYEYERERISLPEFWLLNLIFSPVRLLSDESSVMKITVF
jgi:hypothetical protein